MCEHTKGYEKKIKKKKKSCLLHLEKGESFLLHAANDESQIENRLLEVERRLVVIIRRRGFFES